MTMSSSQRTFQREADALDKMPKSAGEAACTGDTRFDIVTQADRISKETRNDLARTCAKCPLWDCGFRLVQV